LRQGKFRLPYYQGDIVIDWNGERRADPAGTLFDALGPDSIGQTVTIGLRRRSSLLRCLRCAILAVGGAPTAPTSIQDLLACREVIR
jgi:hypothetical protein